MRCHICPAPVYHRPSHPWPALSCGHVLCEWCETAAEQLTSFRHCGALAFPTLAGPHAPALDGACPVCDDRVRCPKCGVFHGLDPYTDPRAAACLTGWSAPPVVIGPPAFRDAWLSYRGFLPTVMAPLQHVVLPDGAPTHPDPARAWPPAVPEELQPSAPPGGPVYSPFAAAAQL